MKYLLRKHLTTYKIAVFISTLSLVFGIFREFLIVSMLGFSKRNDVLQLYLSIFYTIGLTIDAMRLSCLNLYNQLNLSRILLAASIICLPFVTFIALLMNYSSGGLDTSLLIITILGSYLNLIAALLITYKQRGDVFLPAQIINALPNFILIPGIIICYFISPHNPVYPIVCLTSFIPVAQCAFLFMLRNRDDVKPHNQLSLRASLLVFIRHFAAMINDQLYQVITRAAFYRFGTGYLSLFAFAIRIYSAARFILVDSFIGSKLANWETKLERDDYLGKIINLTLVSALLATITFLLSLKTYTHFSYSALQMCFLLSAGFIFSTLVRVMYFKINQQENNTWLVLRFALCEFICMLAALLWSMQSDYPIVTLLWIGYIVKPFAQILLLRKKYHGLVAVQGMQQS